MIQELRLSIINKVRIMQHAERLKLAHEITAKILEKYAEDVLLAGVCCSVARGDDGQHSDVDFVFVTKNL